MSITILIVLFSIVAVFTLGLLENLLEGGSSCVPNRKLSAHLSKPFPDGFYTYYSEDTLPIFSWAFALSILGFVWVSTNLPELFSLAVVYAVLGIFVAAISFAEIIAPKRTYFTALAVFTGENVDSGLLLLMGLGIGAVFVPLNFAMGFGISIKPFLIEESPKLSLILLGFAIPFIEEGTFGATIGASAIEEGGIIVGSVLIVSLWVAFHYLAWAPLTVGGIMFLALFRVFALAPLIKYKSALPGFVAHIAVNVSVVLASMGVLAV